MIPNAASAGFGVPGSPPVGRRPARCATLLALLVAGAGSGCNEPGDEKPSPLVSEATFRLDSGHFMQGMVAGDTYLVGLSFNGLAAFDRATWKPSMFPGPHCARL